jgi:thiamine-monophosphate kinase
MSQMQRRDLVRDLGEQGLLKRLQRFCPAGVVGDDAALLKLTAGHRLVVTTDMLIDGVHFSDRTTSPIDAGWRAAAANLSDLAAMGAKPIGITVGLGLPGDTEVAWVEGLYQGLSQCLQPDQTPIVGGDICRSQVITVAITALGEVLPAQAIHRDQARLGDVILVTGLHGGSRAGLELLLHPEQGQNLSPTDRQSLIRAHQRPQPRLDVIAALETIRTASATEPALLRLAGMDSSDGLADAVLQICRASRVGAILQRNLIPFPPGLTAWVSEATAIDWALYGGEDFELVLCLPRPMAQQLITHLPGAAIIGTITAEPQVILNDASGLHPPEVLSLAKGFQHY